MRALPSLRLERDLRCLSRAFPLWIGDDDKFVVVSGLKLPPGYNYSTTDLLIEIPDSYPVTPPGVANHVFINPHLRLHGRELEDLHTYTTPKFDTPGFGPWAWLCYEHIDWWPERDDLIKFVEMVRADLSKPKTRSRWSLL
jgi:hypothetical protein